MGWIERSAASIGETYIELMVIGFIEAAIIEPKEPHIRFDYRYANLHLLYNSCGENS